MDREARLAKDGYTGVEPVLFYSPKDENGMGSNFSNHMVILPHPFTGERIGYKTGEHRYQAMKTKTHEQHESIRLASSSFLAKKLGGATELRDDWGNDYGDYCYFVMLEVIMDKTARHTSVKSWLASTGQRPIYEDSPVDDIWGWRYEHYYGGKNLLGRCWMQVREVL